jgi:hypothetical protein
MSADYPQNVDEVREWIERRRNQLLDLLEAQPEAALVERTDAAGWSAKDHVIHMAMWERGIVYLLRKQPRHVGMGVPEDVFRGHDVDRTNDLIYRQHRDKDWANVRREFDDVHRELLATLDGLTWEDVQRPYSHYAPNEPGEDNGDPVAYWIAGNTYGHYDQHREWIEALLARR